MFRKELNHRENLFPKMNLQMFADGADSGSDGAEDGSDGKPSYDDLIVQLASERANAERLKNQNNKLASEAAENKRKLREKMSAEEVQAEEKKNADKAKDERIKELETKMILIEHTSRLSSKDFGMDEATAKATAEAFVKGDLDSFWSYMTNHIKATRDSGYQQALSERPEINAGHGSEDKDSSALQFVKNRKQATRSVNNDILKKYTF